MEPRVIQGEVCWLAHSTHYPGLASTGATWEEAVANIRQVETIMARLTAKRLLAELHTAGDPPTQEPGS